MTDRREQIADAGIGILASKGARALTHLNIDRDLGFPDGSTSYYARTRRDLISLVVDRLATHSSGDLPTSHVESPLSPQSTASWLVSALDATIERADRHHARLVLLLECHNDPELHRALAIRPQVRDSFTCAATAILRQLRTDQPETHAPDLVGLLDALLMQRTIRTAPINEEAIITAYLTGLQTSGAGPL